MSATHLTAWQLWHSQFKDGDECFVLDEDERVYVGKITAKDHHLIIKTRDSQHRIHWLDVAFVSHLGFPARKLMGADGSQLADQLNTSSTTRAMRQLLTAEQCSRCTQLTIPTLMNSETRLSKKPKPGHRCPVCVTLTFSDPYLIEGVDARLYFPGNSGPQFWVEDEEEVLVMTARDGARGMLWAIQSAFHFEVS